MSYTSQELSSLYKNAKYPNLLAEHLSGWCVDALACGANVSREVMLAVLRGEDDLSLSEKRKLSNYTWCNSDYLFSPSLAVLIRGNLRHQIWVDELMNGLDKLSPAAKARNIRAIKFMDGYERTNLVNFDLDFRNRELVTYARYRRVKQTMQFALHETFGYPDEVPIRRTPIAREKAL